MKKIFLFSGFIMVALVALFSSCSKDKERVTIEEDKIVGTWNGSYTDDGSITIAFRKGVPNYTFRGSIFSTAGDTPKEYERIEGMYNLFGNTLKLYVQNVSRKDDDEGWVTIVYNEWVTVNLTFTDENNVTARWGKNMTATVKR